MKKDKSENWSEKNKMESSQVSAGGEVHIGDKIYHYNSESGRSPKSSKLSSSLVWTLLSITIIGITISIKQLNLFNINIPAATDSLSQKTVTESNENKKDHPEIKEVDKRPQTANPPKAIPKEILLSDYVDMAQSIQVALLNATKTHLPVFQGTVIQLFSDQGIKISNSFFRSSFQQKFGNSIPNLELATLRQIGLSEKLNCICQITENIDYEPGEVEGIPMNTARGAINISILNLKTGLLVPVSITMTGAGMSEAAALSSLEEHLLQSEQLKTINVQQCKSSN